MIIDNVLTLDEIDELENLLKSNKAEAIFEELVIPYINDSRTNELGEKVCPHCSSKVKKDGFNIQGKQKYKCKNSECGKSSIAETNTIIFSSSKSVEQWILFIKLQLEITSLAKSAELCDISESTARRWRLKLLNLLNGTLIKDELKGDVYIDETYYNYSDKNCNNAVDKTIKKKRGISTDKISIACAIDENCNIIIKACNRARITSKSLIDTFDGFINENSKVISDSLRSHHKLIDKLNINEWIKIKSGKKEEKGYTLSPIDLIHSKLKEDFLRFYKGVSHKYLQGYISLFIFRYNNKKYYLESEFRKLITSILGTDTTIRCNQIDDGGLIIF